MWKDLFLFDVIEDVDRLFVDRLLNGASTMLFLQYP